MAEYDFFSLVGLPFDPPEKAAKKVIAAIEKTKKELNGLLGTATQQLERDDINGKLDFLNTTYSTILSSDGKLTPAYEDLVKAKIKQEIENLTATVSLLKRSGSRVITNGTIRIHRQKTKLSKEHVEGVFHTAGFIISEIDPLKAMPKFPINADKTYAELEALRNSKNPNPNGADPSLATDLYAFTAYLAGEPENAVEYRISKSTAELATLLDGFAKKLATRNDNHGKLCASLATAGKSYVFNSEDNRQAYEAYLKYKTPSLTKLFSSIVRVSKSDLLDPKFAEECIKQISDVFGSYEASLAIYNKEAGLKDEPYIPEKAVFHVKCQHCQNLAEFSDATEAQRINKCTHCGQKLYKQCKKCHKSIIASLDKCPECGFIFASAVMFAKHFAAAEQAFRKSDYETARDYLYKAQFADPSEKRRTDELAALITKEEKKYEKPIADLRKLIADKMFQKASVAMAGIIGKFPGLNVSSFDIQINSALSQAHKAFENAKKLSPSKQADECLAILQDFVDFKPAISFLHTTPPETCKRFSIGLDSCAGIANISWSRSFEHGVSYRLVRKKGKDMPSNEMDGEVLADNIKETSYQDRSIIPSHWYSYAVFAIRYGVFSSATGKTIVLLADVTDARAEQIDMTVRLTWNTPKNCTGITIRRTQGNTEALLTNNALNSYEDKNVQYGMAYSYRLSANYANLSPSEGVTIVITPMIIIDSFTITAKQLKDNTYRISWNIITKGIDLRVMVDGRKVRELKSDLGSCDLVLPANGLRTVTVLAYSGGGWLRNENDLQINTYSPCSIDKASSYYHEDAIDGLQESAYNVELHLKISAIIPPNVVGFYYAVRTGNPRNRWPTLNEVNMASDIYRIGLSAYLNRGEILFTGTARDEVAYYISLFTIYDFGGNEIVSSPKPCRFDRTLAADLFWRVSKSLLGGIKLSIEISGNRPMSRMPEFVLCACADSQHLLTYNDAKATQLFTIPSTDFGASQKTYCNDYDVKTALSNKELKSAKFFLFQVAPIEEGIITIHWSKGFRGKV